MPGVRIADMPDLGAVTSATSLVAEKSGSGRVLVTAFTTYLVAGLSVATIAALRALTTVSPPAILLVRGYYAESDDGEGAFVLSAASVAADNGGTIIVDALGRRWLRQTEGGPLSVKWFGAKGDGGTDDTVAIQAAINATSAVNGGSVYFPASAGRYIVTATLVVSHPCVTIFGDDRFTTQLGIGSHTFNIFTIAGLQCTIHDLGIVGFGTTATVVYAVNIGSTGGQCTLRYLYIANVHSGITSSGWLFRASHIHCTGLKPVAGRGITILQITGNGEENDLDNCWFENGAGQDASVGLLLINASCVNVVNCQFIKMGNPVWVIPGASQAVLSLTMVDVWCDTSSGVGLVLDGTTGTIGRVSATACWFSSCGYGVQIKGLARGVMLQGCQIWFNTSQGIQVVSGANLAGLMIDGCQIGGNASGIDIAANVSAFSITNNHIGPSADAVGNSAWGIYIAAGTSDDYLITGNRLRGNTTGALSDGGTGVNKYVGNNVT